MTTLDLTIDLEAPPRISRVSLLLRLLIAIALGGVLKAVGWPGSILYFALPALAAVLISQHTAAGYFTKDAPTLVRVLGWIVGFHAYMGLVTDRFPFGAADEPVRLEGEPRGTPTLGSAVARILFTAPLAIVLWLLSIVSAIIWLLAAISVLFVEHYPASWWRFQVGVLRFGARTLVYHASLADRWPPITVDTHTKGARMAPPLGNQISVNPSL